MKTTICILSICLGLVSCGRRSYTAASGSMENTIMTGTEFFVTPTDEYHRNDIVVFEHVFPDFDADEYGERPLITGKKLCRIIAWSGDVVEIRNDEVYVNNRLVPAPAKAIFLYQIRVKGQPPFEIDQNKILYQNKVGDTSVYLAHLMQSEVKEFSAMVNVISVSHYIKGYGTRDSMFARSSLTDTWNQANYGPLRIPSPGDTVEVNEVNFKLFQHVPGVEMGTFIIREKLYFMLGDNRYASEDSRLIGLIAHSKMYGVVE